jgi:hypothetical protein
VNLTTHLQLERRSGKHDLYIHIDPPTGSGQSGYADASTAPQMAPKSREMCAGLYGSRSDFLHSLFIKLGCTETATALQYAVGATHWATHTTQAVVCWLQAYATVLDPEKLLVTKWHSSRVLSEFPGHFPIILQLPYTHCLPLTETRPLAVYRGIFHLYLHIFRLVMGRLLTGSLNEC